MHHSRRPSAQSLADQELLLVHTFRRVVTCTAMPPLKWYAQLSPCYCTPIGHHLTAVVESLSAKHGFEHFPCEF